MVGSVYPDKRDTIISTVKARVRVATHKYGIEVPQRIKHARQLDKKNCNTFWMQALAKEMSNVSIVFELLEQRDKALPGWKNLFRSHHI